MRSLLCSTVGGVLALAMASQSARADEPPAMSMGEMVMGASASTSWDARPGPMLMPIRVMMPGTWSRPGTWSVMADASLILTNPGFADAYDADLGRTHPYLLNDWAMVRGRTKDGWLEGLLMLNFEALTFGRRGWYEVGQQGEGLWDRQHQHQLLHQAVVAVHLVGRTEDDPARVTLWGGQGSAPIGPPVFMHRASNPSPTVPRKHHKGENPHETFPVVGATFELGGAALDVAAFDAREPEPDDSRLYPRAHVPKSFGARLRHRIDAGFEAQLSGIHQNGTGEHDGTQLSASVYGRHVGRFVVDVLVDGAVDVASGEHEAPPSSAGPLPGVFGSTPVHGHDEIGGVETKHPRTAGALTEIAVRTASLRDVLWTRLEVNQRVEPDATRSSPWLFGSLGYERLVWVDPSSVLAFGAFAEATYVVVPESIAKYYGDRTGVTTMLGLRGHLMWMPGMNHPR